jgi:hypothetical protein
VGQGDAGQAIPTRNNRFSYVGSSGFGPLSWSGQIDQVRVYSYARTPAQIAWEYNRGKPIAEWRMNECQGATIHDESGFGNNGTISLGASGQTAIGTCVDNAGTPWYNGRTGKYGASLNFDGADDYVDVPKTIDLNNEITMSAWVYLHSYASVSGSPWWGSRLVLDSYDSGHTYGDDELHGISITGTSNGVAAAIINWDVTVPAANRASVTGNVVPLNQWHFITMTADGSNLKIYQNGSFVAQTSYTNIGLYDPTDLKIRKFAKTANAGYFDGQIDDAKIFNYALTSEQVKTLYNNSSAINFGN